MTTTAPKTLLDLQYQDWVINVESKHTVQTAAEHVLSELFPDDDRTVKVNYLFTELDKHLGEEVKVYEAYKDSGSVDYIYLIKR